MLGSLFENFYSLLNGFVAPKVFVTVADAVGIAWGQKDTSDSGLTIPVSFLAIAAIFLIRNNPEVISAIVSGVSVYVVYNFLRVIEDSTFDPFHNKAAEMNPSPGLSPRFPRFCASFLGSIVTHVKIKFVLFKQVFINVINLEHGLSYPISQSQSRLGGGPSLTLFRK